MNVFKSMTGYGKAEGVYRDKKITVELRSLNSKQLDLSLRLPYFYKDKEMELRGILTKSVERGKADLSVNVDGSSESSVQVNETLLKHYYNHLHRISTELNNLNTDLFSLAMKMPDVMKNEKEEVTEEEWQYVVTLVHECIEKFNGFRKDEGEVLSKDFIHRIHFIKSLLDEIDVLDSGRIAAIKERIRKNLHEAMGVEVDNNRFEQELIYYMEKIDITEEKVRLRSHCDYFLKTMNEAAPGRKLGFIGQEIGREINTIGSKANDVQIQQLVVRMKDELEKVKEQMLNVL